MHFYYCRVYVNISALDKPAGIKSFKNRCLLFFCNCGLFLHMLCHNIQDGYELLTRQTKAAHEKGASVDAPLPMASLNIIF